MEDFYDYLWCLLFEPTANKRDEAYDYKEERAKEKYYDEKEQKKKEK